MNDLCTWLSAISTTAIAGSLSSNSCMKGIVGQQIWIMWVLKEREWSKLDDSKSMAAIFLFTSVFRKLTNCRWRPEIRSFEFWTICILLWQQIPPCNIETKRKLLNKNLNMPYPRRKTERWNLMGKEVVTIALLVTMLLVVLMLVL